MTEETPSVTVDPTPVPAGETTVIEKWDLLIVPRRGVGPTWFKSTDLFEGNPFSIHILPDGTVGLRRLKPPSFDYAAVSRSHGPEFTGDPSDPFKA